MAAGTAARMLRRGCEGSATRPREAARKSRGDCGDAAKELRGSNDEIAGGVQGVRGGCGYVARKQ